MVVNDITVGDFLTSYFVPLLCTCPVSSLNRLLILNVCIFMNIVNQVFTVVIRLGVPVVRGASNIRVYFLR